MRLGLVSDTHGVYDQALSTLLTDVHQILHAGDVGHKDTDPHDILSKLSAIAPTLAVRGNVDTGAPTDLFPESRVLVLSEWKTIVTRQRSPSVAVQSRGAPQRRQLAERIYAYEAALPEDLLQRGIGPPGNTNRLLKVFNKLMTGLPVSLSFIGGSITEGGGVPFHDRAPLSFTGKVTNWVRDTYPNASVRVQNAGVGGVTSLYYAQCVDMFVPD
ncbi:hypothetical protein WJX79_010467, partial [Trebouxia sp. C0005]